MNKIIEKSFSDIDLTEGEGSIRLHFLALCANKKGGSGNIYSQKILQQAADEFNKKIERHGMAYGGLGHKKDGLEVDDVSHVLERIDYSPEKQGLMVTAKIIPTSKGRTIGTLLKNSARIGVSMRGTGRTDDNGNVQEYHIQGCDFVLQPSQDLYVDKGNLYESQPFDLTELDLLTEKYRAAILAGYRGTKEQFSKDVLQPMLETKKADVGDLHQASIDRSKALPKAADGFPKTYAPGNPQDGKEDESDLAAAEKLLDAIKEGLSKLGMELTEVDEGETVVFAFNMNESQYYKIPWTLLPDGQVQLGRPEPIEV